MRGLATQRRLTACYGVKGHNKNLLTFLYLLTITERGVALSTSTATVYKYSVAGHLSFGAPKFEKAQKSSGFWANRTYRHCIKDNVLIDPAVGSGAFPLGMLNEIVRARQNISAYMAITMNPYETRMMYNKESTVQLYLVVVIPFKTRMMYNLIMKEYFDMKL